MADLTDQNRVENVDSGPLSLEALVPLVYAHLHRLAEGYCRTERSDHTLQPTALVHEAYLRVSRQREWKSREQLLGVAATAMRRVLIDHANRRGTLKRGGQRLRVSLSHATALFEEKAGSLVALHEALKELEAVDSLKGRMVELRFFGGLTVVQISAVLGVSVRYVERSLRFAKAWLRKKLAER